GPPPGPPGTPRMPPAAPGRAMLPAGPAVVDPGQVPWPEYRSQGFLPPMRVAILEDTIAQAITVAGWLEKAGFKSIVRHEGNGFIRMLETEQVDMLLLDLDVPGKSGIEVLRWARERRPDNLPVVMLSQCDSEESIVEGLENGADDYLVKPAGERELIARVRAQMRRYYPERVRGHQLTVGNYTLDLASRSARLTVGAHSQVVNLPAREFALAEHLFRNVGRIVRKDDLIRQIWGEVDRRYDATLATYISKLRNALELRAKNGLIISTVYNHGYRLEQLPCAPRAEETGYAAARARLARQYT